MIKGLKIHIWKMHELSENSAKEIYAENISANCETFKFELCDKEANSEPALKVHKAKWPTNVAPYYRNIPRLLADQEMFLEDCIIYIYFKDDIIGTGKTAPLVNSQPMTASSYLSSEVLPPLFLSISVKPFL